MRRSSILPVALLLALPLLASAQPDSGKRWEVKMKLSGMSEQDMREYEEAMQSMPPGMTIPGMPQFEGGAMVQKLCMPADETEPPPANEDCTLLEQRSSGNTHHVKMRCPDGTIELDQTRTDSTMTTHMKMTDNKGKVEEMDMTGRVLGPCDYTAEVDAQRRQVAQVQQQVERAQKASAAQVAQICREGVEKMQGQMFAKGGVCEAQRADFCARAQTLEGYRLLHGNLASAPDLPGYRADDQLQPCGTTDAKLRATLCPKAVSARDFRFVDQFCPEQRPRLCDAALEREEFWYIDRHCAEARAKLVAEHCAGRKFSSQIAPKYRDFCAGALGGDLKGDGSGAGADAAPAGTPADPVQQGVKKGVEGLKKVFGF